MVEMADTENPETPPTAIEWSNESKKYAIRIHRLMGFLIVAMVSPHVLILGVLVNVWNGTIEHLAWRFPLTVALLALAFVGIHLHSKYSVNTYSAKHSVIQFVKSHSGMFERGLFDVPYSIFMILTIVGATVLGWLGWVAMHLLSNTATYSLLELSQGVFASMCVTLALSVPIFMVIKRFNAQSIEKLRI